ncbi:MAG: DciA family protein [Burkholderiales bacterium]
MPRGHIQRPRLGQAVRDDDNLQLALRLPYLSLRPAKADQYLILDEGMGPVVAKARLIRELTRTCADFLPPALGRQLRAASLRDGDLCLLAHNPAAAAKLKLVAETLRKFLLQQGTKVNTVSVRVQPTRSHEGSESDPVRPVLTEAGKAELSALYRRLPPESPAGRALLRLLERQGVKTGARTRAKRS